jgi:hypothetical protein
VLEFHVIEAEKQLAGVNDFLLNSDEFEKIKEAFETKPARKRTQPDLDLYNEAFNDMNAALITSNKVFTAMNRREKVLENWHVTHKRFMELHVPKGR